MCSNQGTKQTFHLLSRNVLISKKMLFKLILTEVKFTNKRIFAFIFKALVIKIN